MDAHCAEKANAVVDGHEESHENPGQTRMQGGVTLCSTKGGWQSQALIDTHQLRRPRSRQSMDWSSEKAALKFKHTQDGPKQDSTRRCFQLADPQISDDARRALDDVAAEVVARPLGSGCSCPAQKRLRCCTHRAAMVAMPQRPGPALRLVAVMCGWCRRRTNVAHHPPNLRVYQPQCVAVHSCALETTSPATSLPLTLFGRYALPCVAGADLESTAVVADSGGAGAESGSTEQRLDTGHHAHGRGGTVKQAFSPLWPQQPTFCSTDPEG